jgi:4-hydroxy-tetrahydrodipicolinate reductase
MDRKTTWSKEIAALKSDLVIKSERIDEVPGTHDVVYESEIDKITISHVAKNREGFALGAVLAAEFLNKKTGIYSMRQVLGLN